MQGESSRVLRDAARNARRDIMEAMELLRLLERTLAHHMDEDIHDRES
jgi:hypothetical protein